MELQLKEIGIKNFLSYKDAKFSDFKNFNVLIGKNSSGKSNLFKILELLKAIYDGKSFSKNFLFNEIDAKAEIYLRFILSTTLRESLFQVLYKKNYLQKAFIRNESEEGYLKRNEWNKEDNAVKWLLEKDFYQYLDLNLNYIPELNRIIITQISLYNGMYDKSQPFFSANFIDNTLKTHYLNLEVLVSRDNPLLYFFSDFTPTEIGFNQETYNDIFISARNFKENPILQILLNSLSKNFFKAIHHIPDKRKFDRDSSRENIASTTLDPDGTNLVKFIHKKKVMNEDRWLNEFNDKLRSYMSEIERLGDNIDINSDRAMLILKENGLDMELKWENMGAGILNIALFLAYMMEMEENSILFIEEPELFIFPGLQKLVMDEFLKNSIKIQIYITTHSPHFISRNLDNTAIYQIEKINNSTLVKKISDENILEVFNELDLSLFDYLLYDGILFVEGQNDLNVLKIISDEIFEQRFKIIQCYGKRNFRYYAEAEILNLLTESDLNFLFLLDLDRGNENIWSNIQDDELREILEEHTIKLFSYEIENIFLQPILIIDYIFTKNKIQNLVADSRWLFENLERIFTEKGENNLKYILKKFIDSNYGWFGRDDYDYIYNGSESISTFDNLYNYWIDKIEELLNKKSQFCEIKCTKKTKLLEKFNEIKKIYDKNYNNKEYQKVISGKGVIKELKVLIFDRFKLSETISVENLAMHLIKFLNDYNYLLPEKGKITHNYEFKDEFLGYELDKIPLTEEELTDFTNYCNKVKQLIVGIKNKLDCEFQGDFEKLDRIDFHHMFAFLIKRWKLSL